MFRPDAGEAVCASLDLDVTAGTAERAAPDYRPPIAATNQPAKKETVMTTLRKTLAIALTAATLGFGAIAAPPSASAHGYGHFHRDFGRVGHRFGWGHHFGWGHNHRFGWGVGHRCFYHWGCHRGGEHRWGYHWRGYRRIGEAAVGAVEAPRAIEAPRVVVAPSCPAGTHLGYLGKYCWPNRR
jgi:hypothetical protein